jgi:hypothetical protein
LTELNLLTVNNWPALPAVGADGSTPLSTSLRALDIRGLEKLQGLEKLTALTHLRVTESKLEPPSQKLLAEGAALTHLIELKSLDLSRYAPPSRPCAVPFLLPLLSRSDMTDRL